MRFFKHKILKWSNLFLIGSTTLFLALVYFNYPLFLDKIYEEVGYFHAHLDKKQIDTPHYQFSYVERGKGKTILLVHGFRSDKNYWLDYIRKMGKGYHYIALDLPWHGETLSKEKVKFSVKNVAAALDEFVQAKKIDKCYIVGSSLGAGFVLEYSRNHLDTVQKVVLVNPFALKPSTPAKVRAMLEKNKKLFSPATLEQLDYLLICLRGATLQCPDHLKYYLLEKLKSKNGMVAKMMEDIAHSEGMEQHLPQITMPVLILQGEKDCVVYSGDKLIYQELLPNLDYVDIKEGYHIFSKKSLKTATLEMKRFLAK